MYRLTCLTHQDHYPKETFPPGFFCKHLVDITCGIGLMCLGRVQLTAHGHTLPHYSEDKTLHVNWLLKTLRYSWGSLGRRDLDCHWHWVNLLAALQNRAATARLSRHLKWFNVGRPDQLHHFALIRYNKSTTINRTCLIIQFLLSVCIEQMLNFFEDRSKCRTVQKVWFEIEEGLLTICQKTSLTLQMTQFEGACQTTRLEVARQMTRLEFARQTTWLEMILDKNSSHQLTRSRQKTWQGWQPPIWYKESLLSCQKTW